MKLEPFEWTLGAAIFAIFMVLVTSIAGFVGYESWRASEKAAAYKAYVECLHEMKEHSIDVKQTFCGRIREQL